MTLDKADMTWLGRAKKATVTKDDTILLDGAGNKDMIEDRNEQLRQAISSSTSEYDRCDLLSSALPRHKILSKTLRREQANFPAWLGGGYG